MHEKLTAKYSPITGVIRVYDKDNSYHDKSPFIAIATIVWVNDTTALVEGMLSINRNKSIPVLLSMIESLKKVGVEKVQMYRSKKKRMPFGKKIKECDFENLWEVDLMQDFGRG